MKEFLLENALISYFPFSYSADFSFFLHYHNQLSKMEGHLKIGSKLRVLWAIWGTLKPFLVQPSVSMDAPLIVVHIFEVKINFGESHSPDTKFSPFVVRCAIAI